MPTKFIIRTCDTPVVNLSRNFISGSVNDEGEKKKMLPLFLDLRAKKVVVFGGGPVGLRKAKYFAKESDVKVISKDFCEGFDRTDAEIVKEDARDRLAHWIEWADIVIAATDDPIVNGIVVDRSISMNKLYNCADGRSNFLIPSIVERDGYTVAVSTMGKSPAMSKFLRMKIDEMLVPEFGRMIALQEAVREEARESIPDQPSREKFLWAVLEDQNIWQAVRVNDAKKAMTLARERMVRFVGFADQRARDA